MSTATIKLIHKHGSVRKYLSDPVPENLVIEIVQSAQRAATSSNLPTGEKTAGLGRSADLF